MADPAMTVWRFGLGRSPGVGPGVVLISSVLFAGSAAVAGDPITCARAQIRELRVQSDHGELGVDLCQRPARHAARLLKTLAQLHARVGSALGESDPHWLGGRLPAVHLRSTLDGSLTSQYLADTDTIELGFFAFEWPGRIDPAVYVHELAHRLLVRGWDGGGGYRGSALADAPLLKESLPNLVAQWVVGTTYAPDVFLAIPSCVRAARHFDKNASFSDARAADFLFATLAKQARDCCRRATRDRPYSQAIAQLCWRWGQEDPPGASAAPARVASVATRERFHARTCVDERGKALCTSEHLGLPMGSFLWTLSRRRGVFGLAELLRSFESEAEVPAATYSRLAQFRTLACEGDEGVRGQLFVPTSRRGLERLRDRWIREERKHFERAYQDAGIELGLEAEERLLEGRAVEVFRKLNQLQESARVSCSDSAHDAQLASRTSSFWSGEP